MNDVYILGVESSCDETSLSIVKNGSEEIRTITATQIAIHQKFGGVVPEVASRHHVQNITYCLEELFLNLDLKIEDITAIAVTQGPGLNGCLLVGMEFAKTISFVYNLPLVVVDHMAGHIYAALLENKIEFPALALVVSGGHTELVYLEDKLKYKIVGHTKDDAVGECYDKVAKVLGLNYPGGPNIERLSKLGNPTYNLPLPLNDNSLDFSFSGLKSAVINLVHNTHQRGEKIQINDMAASFQLTIETILSKKLFLALKAYQVKTVVLAGGVAANTGVRLKIASVCEEKKVNFICPAINHCTDNAAMIATIGYYNFLAGKTVDFSVDVDPSLNLEGEQ